MTRKLRVEYPGAICRVMNHGNRRKQNFQDQPGWMAQALAARTGNEDRKASGDGRAPLAQKSGLMQVRVRLSVTLKT